MTHVLTRLRSPLIAVALALVGTLLPGHRDTHSAWAASEIRASFGPIQASIPLESLETYVDEGIIDEDLEPYIRYLSEDQVTELRTFLSTSIALDVDILTVSHFLYSDPGEVLLKRVGNIVRTRENNGFFALRAAILLAATDDQGFTPLNVIRQFPTDSLVLDFETGWGIARDTQQAINQSADAIALVRQQFETALAANPPGPVPPRLSRPPALRYAWHVERGGIPLKNRAFPVDVYLPQRESPAPIIVISHGLGSTVDSYQYLARHLVSSGFVVVVPEHEGSNAEHIQALLQGKAEDVAEPREFINRAEDISLILTELINQAETAPELIGRLDVDQIGVIGQSFGGYTALALGGATVHFDHLRDRCPTAEAIENGEDRSLNLSLLLQCRALDLATTEAAEGAPPLETLSLHDERIDAILAINPIGSAIFGPDGFQSIDIPVLMMTGSADVIAPTLWEQIYPFSWLQTPEKFLVTMHRGTHFSTIGTSDEDIPLPEAILGPVPQVAQRYVRAISLSFFQTYLNDAYGGNDASTTVQPLTPAYIDRLSRDPMPLSIIQDFDIDNLD